MRDDLAAKYLDNLPFEPYPMQEEALLAWFSSDQGVLVCAPTGMGKTLIAEAAVFEALHTRKRAYYTTPLIALTEQKFRELQARAVSWGFEATDVGLVTGNRRENPEATVLVVVAEILFNRLLHGEAFDFADVESVVMDEFHSFNDRERGIVWEFSLALLPEHVRTLLLSATVGNSREFVYWLSRNFKRKLDLVESDERKVPLTFHWVGDKLLSEHLEDMAAGGNGERTVPALIFCFNREQCWTVAELIKGRKVIGQEQQKALDTRLKAYDLSQGAGPKLRQCLLRGVGVHHAGVLPKYRRIVEDLFQEKLLSVAVCTETLAAGINLPARSVVLPTIMKGPPDKKRIIDASSAHQIFGRAGRPQYDDKGHVFVLAHEDDVKISRWKEQYDQIPENTKDPGLIKAKKRLKKKMPKRRTGEQYWNELQFEKLCAAPPRKLESVGLIPWRLLVFVLQAAPEVEPLRKLVSKRLMNPKALEKGQDTLDQMLLTLWRAGYIELEPHPPKKGVWIDEEEDAEDATPAEERKEPEETPAFGGGILAGLETASRPSEQTSEKSAADKSDEERPARRHYRAKIARPTEKAAQLSMLRGIHPLYGIFVINQLGGADTNERIQAMESVLELPGSIGKFVRVPNQEELPPGPLATNRLDPLLLSAGLATAEELTYTPRDEEAYRNRRSFEDPPPRVLNFAEKLRMVFDYEFPTVHDVRTNDVWAVGEVLQYTDFNKYVTAKSLQKQEGVVFRHLLRFILLANEIAEICPPDMEEADWRAEMADLSDRITNICRLVDPSSTQEALDHAAAAKDTL